MTGTSDQKKLGQTRIALLILFVGLAVGAAPVTADTDWDRKLRVASEVLRDLEDLPEGDLPEDLIADSNCIAVIPHVVKGAFWVGGRHGRGLLSCRDQDGNESGPWSPPVAVRISGLSVGAQFGGQITDLVLFFLNRRGVESLLESRVTLGADVSVAAGQVGRSAEAATDIRFKAEIYAYAKSRGVFAGVAVSGSHLGIANKGMRRLYGENRDAESVLFGDVSVSEEPRDLEAFLAALPESSDG